MALLKGIRAGLAKNLQTIPAPRQISPYMLANPTPPTLQVMGPEEVVYHFTSASGLHSLASSRWRLVVQGFAAASYGDEGAQRLIDDWLDDDGPSSVRAALEAEPTLGGLVDDVTVVDSRGYLMYVIEGRGAVLGADWVVDVLA